MPFSADRLRQARLHRGLSQIGLAQALGVVAQQVLKWEKHVSVPAPETLARMAQLLGCTTDWLLELVDEPTGYLYSETLSDTERQFIELYRQGELPELIQRLVTELAHGKVQKDPIVDSPRESNVAP